MTESAASEKTPGLDPGDILIAEFEYAAQTTQQANDDRVSVVNYYFAAMGTLLATVVLLDLQNATHLAVFGAITFGLAVLGIMSLLKLAKLRLAWNDSARAMCRIKEYYIREFPDRDLAPAFRWRMETIPAAGKKWSLAFLMAMTTALLSSASSGGALFLWGLALGHWWAVQGIILSEPIPPRSSRRSPISSSMHAMPCPKGARSPCGSSGNTPLREQTRFPQTSRQVIGSASPCPTLERGCLRMSEPTSSSPFSRPRLWEAERCWGWLRPMGS